MTLGQMRAALQSAPVSLQGQLNISPTCRVAGHDLDSIRKKLRMLLKPASHIVACQLSPIDSGEITQIMIQVKEVPVLLSESLDAFLECACNAVSWKVALIINE